MRNVVKVLGALVALVLIAGALYGRARVAESRGRLEAAQLKMSVDWTEFKDDVERDAARWKSEPLVAARDGGDASKLVFQHVRWENDGKPAPVPAPVNEAFASHDGGWSQPEAAVLAELDTAWMTGLDAYGYWDIEPLDGPLEGKPFQPINEDLPRFIDAQQLAKVHLAKGLAAGDARPAARDVRELARLLLTTEQLIGEMVAVALLGIERRAHGEAVRRGHDVSGWQPYSEADVTALKRLLWAAEAPRSMLATGELAKTKLPIGACAALKEAITFGHFLRGYAEDLVPERYEAIDRGLAEEPCRLRRARAAWKSNTPDGQLPVDGKALCTDEYGKQPPECKAPAWVMSVPFVRPFIGYTLVSIASTDWFKQYRPKTSDE